MYPSQREAPLRLRPKCAEHQLPAVLAEREPMDCNASPLPSRFDAQEEPTHDQAGHLREAIQPRTYPGIGVHGRQELPQVGKVSSRHVAGFRGGRVSAILAVVSHEPAQAIFREVMGEEKDHRSPSLGWMLVRDSTC